MYDYSDLGGREMNEQSLPTDCFWAREFANNIKTLNICCFFLHSTPTFFSSIIFFSSYLYTNDSRDSYSIVVCYVILQVLQYSILGNYNLLMQNWTNRACGTHFQFLFSYSFTASIYCSFHLQMFLYLFLFLYIFKHFHMNSSQSCF